jgi:hypothetical protein
VDWTIAVTATPAPNASHAGSAIRGGSPVAW